MKNVTRYTLIVIAGLLGACDQSSVNQSRAPAPKPITPEMKLVIQGAEDFGRDYGMAKRCELKQADQFHTLYQRSLSDKLAANGNALWQAQKNYSLAAKTEQAKSSPVNCATVSSNLGTLISGLQRKTD